MTSTLLFEKYSNSINWTYLGKEAAVSKDDLKQPQVLPGRDKISPKKIEQLVPREKSFASETFFNADFSMNANRRIRNGCFRYFL